jgi:purine-binding chemotaxis protein CheW
MVAVMQLDTRMAQPPAQEAARSQFLTFSLGGEVLAMEIHHVKEILQYSGITEVPLTAPEIRGVLNLRGAVVPVIDLAVRFGRAATDTDKRTCIIILEVGEGEAMTVMGIMVDHVSEVVEIPPADLEPPPVFGNKLRADFIRGVGRIGGRFVLILEMERVLSLAELAGQSEG